MKREIGRGKFVVTQFIILGSYGVVFKAYKKNTDNDLDKNGKRKCYAIKRIFPTINAAFILIEMLILQLLK